MLRRDQVLQVRGAELLLGQRCGVGRDPRCRARRRLHVRFRHQLQLGVGLTDTEVLHHRTPIVEDRKHLQYTGRDVSW